MLQIRPVQASPGLGLIDEMRERAQFNLGRRREALTIVKYVPFINNGYSVIHGPVEYQQQNNGSIKKGEVEDEAKYGRQILKRDKYVTLPELKGKFHVQR